jgi:hypothetical protein
MTAPVVATVDAGDQPLLVIYTVGEGSVSNLSYSVTGVLVIRKETPDVNIVMRATDSIDSTVSLDEAHRVRRRRKPIHLN